MYQHEKVDSTGLWAQIDQHLNEKGINTPMSEKYAHMTDDNKVVLISNKIKECLEILGLDLEDDSLVETPKRVAKMWVKELFWGLDPARFPKATTVENKMGYDEVVVERDITVMSACEHHLVVIDGKAHVAYIPKDKVLGLSKLNRIVEYFSRRPQIQERLTMQIGEALKYILGTDDVAVVVDAVHYCVKSRGVEDHSSSTATSFLSGAFKNEHETRKEFFDLISSRKG